MLYEISGLPLAALFSNFLCIVYVVFILCVLYALPTNMRTTNAIQSFNRNSTTDYSLLRLQVECRLVNHISCNCACLIFVIDVLLRNTPI